MQNSITVIKKARCEIPMAKCWIKVENNLWFYFVTSKICLKITNNSIYFIDFAV